MISLALFQPDIPQNTGNILRTADCFGIHVDIIEPCGFIFGGIHMKRAGMDYLNTVSYKLHKDFSTFLAHIFESNKRLVLATTKTDKNYLDFNFTNSDVILMGSESSGVPESIHNIIADKIKISMLDTKRSLNLAVASSIILAEAMRQLS